MRVNEITNNTDLNDLKDNSRAEADLVEMVKKLYGEAGGTLPVPKSRMEFLLHAIYEKLGEGGGGGSVDPADIETVVREWFEEHSEAVATGFNVEFVDDGIEFTNDQMSVEEAVAEYLDDHPEATTTVQDGAISYAKLDSNLKAKADDVSDLKSQTPKVVDSDATGIDIDLTDGQGHVLARFANGGVQTKAFDSTKSSAVVPTDATDSDIDFVDGQGNVVVRLAGGHIQTKGFDSESAVESIEALTDAVGSDYVVPDCWITYLQEKEAAINALNMALDSGESFIFFTDYHQKTNNKNSAPLMRHIVDHTSITDVVYGGDTTDGGTLPTPQAAEAVVRAFSNLFKPLKIKPVRGNHDCEPTAYQTVNQIPDAAWYDMMIRPIENEVVSGNELYFYYDNPNQKIRHIVMDSGGMNDALTETQLTWMKARLTELETGWTAIIFQHMVVESTPAEQTVHMISRGTKTLNAIGDVYNSLNCTIAAFVCGHMHVDAIVDTDYNFKIIATTCDAGGANSQGYDWNNPTRPAGTTNEQAFDVYSIDTTNRTINITRIGAGSNRSVQY